ncbi:hypothetical protein BJF78_22585 [Pseudonocardia sp. CNS-139]|nr:hypothetical protein BJF78_22585 [Pseudonocardia sp. CNS-139]
MIAPEAAAASIAASGAVLVALGAVAPFVTRRIRRPRPAGPHADDRPTVEMPTIEIERAA